MKIEFLTRKEVETTKQKGKKEDTPLTGLSPRNRKACHSIITALLKSIAKIRPPKILK
jgi:hypothetical protein